jgi:hypothetical protein
MAWRSEMGRVLVGRSLVGRLWHRSLLGIYTRWLGLELSLSVSEAASRTTCWQSLMLLAGIEPLDAIFSCANITMTRSQLHRCRPRT